MSEQVKTPNYVTIVKLQEMTDEGYCYIAYHPELPNTISQGDTPEEASEALTEATQMTIAHLLANGLPIPQPRNLQVAFSNAPGIEPTDGYSVSATPRSSEKSSSLPTLAPSGQLIFT